MSDFPQLIKSLPKRGAEKVSGLLKGYRSAACLLVLADSAKRKDDIFGLFSEDEDAILWELKKGRSALPRDYFILGSFPVTAYFLIDYFWAAAGENFPGTEGANLFEFLVSASFVVLFTWLLLKIPQALIDFCRDVVSVHRYGYNNRFIPNARSVASRMTGVGEEALYVTEWSEVANDMIVSCIPYEDIDSIQTYQRGNFRKTSVKNESGDEIAYLLRERVVPDCLGFGGELSRKSGVAVEKYHVRNLND